MCFTFVDFELNTFTFVLIMLEIVDREIKGSNYFQNFCNIGTMYM